MINQDIINKFKKTCIYKNIINNPDIIFIYISGSRMTNHDNENSDYDITAVFTSEQLDNSFNNTIYNPAVGKCISMRINNINIHWYKQAIFNYYNPAINTSIGFIGAVSKLYYLSDDNIIYRNFKHKKILDELLKNKLVYAKFALNILLKKEKEYIDACTKINKIFFKRPLSCNNIEYPKIFYTIIISAMSIFPEINVEKDFLLRLKDINEKKLNNQDELITLVILGRIYELFTRKSA